MRLAEVAEVLWAEAMAGRSRVFSQRPIAPLGPSGGEAVNLWPLLVYLTASSRPSKRGADGRADLGDQRPGSGFLSRVGDDGSPVDVAIPAGTRFKFGRTWVIRWPKDDASQQFEVLDGPYAGLDLEITLEHTAQHEVLARAGFVCPEDFAATDEAERDRQLRWWLERFEALLTPGTVVLDAFGPTSVHRS